MNVTPSREVPETTGGSGEHGLLEDDDRGLREAALAASPGADDRPPPAASAPALNSKFWTKVDASGDCWEWTGGREEKGYGRFHGADQRNRAAHRVAWEQLVGPVAEGLQLDHLCRNPGCVNPDHLEPVTPSVNVRRSAYNTVARKAARSLAARSRARIGGRFALAGRATP